MFEFLFKYPFAAFQQGQLVLLGAWPRWLYFVLLVVAAAGLALYLRGGETAPVLRSWRLGVIGLLEWLTVAVLLVLLWEPALVVTELEPRQNIVAILVDDSRSMNQTEEGSTREEQAIRALQSGVLPRLQRNFQTRLFRFDTHLTRMANPTELGPAVAPATHIGASLEQLVTQMGDLPLGAVVLLSDGGDNTGVTTPGASIAMSSTRCVTGGCLCIRWVLERRKWTGMLRSRMSWSLGGCSLARA